MSRKSKEFIELQNKWYKKLKREGFEDIEYYNPKTGLGQGSPYLMAKNNPTTGQIRARYSTELQNHYRLSRNFLSHGPFYSNLKDKYLKSRENGVSQSQNGVPSSQNGAYSSDFDGFTDQADQADLSASQFRTKFPSFPSFLRAQAVHYSRAEEACWSFYCDGLTIREISKELRRLHHRNRLGKPPKRWGKAAKGVPYSIFWVKSTIDRLKVESIRFNATHPEGIDLWSEESTENPENSST